MRPKKRPADCLSTPEPTHDNIEADHELFLQAFEKPTQIYRYLRTRQAILPVFLPRTLWYMKGRLSVPNTKRKNFKVDSLLAIVSAKNLREHQPHRNKPDVLNVKFSGFFNVDVHTDAEFAEAEIQLLKNGHRKRKSAVSSCPSQVSLGKTKIPINPGLSSSYHDNVASITHRFTHSNGSLARSCGLFVKVTCPIRRNLPNGFHNGDLHNHDEPIQKRRKNGRMSFHEEEPMLFGAAVRVYDRNRQCLLCNGQYQIVLTDLQSYETLPGRTASWLSVTDPQDLEPFKIFDKLPTIKFDLTWDEGPNSSALPASQDSLSPRSVNNFSENNITTDSKMCPSNISSSERAQVMHDGVTHKNPTTGTKSTKPREPGLTTPRKRLRLQYCFQYGNGETMRQQTEVREDLRCPWCALLCPSLFALLKHLRLTHARFNFIYVPHSKGPQIEVTVNEMYDGSYVGNPHDVHSHIGYAFSRSGPVRRTPVTHVIVYRPKRPAPSLNEFMEPESDSSINRQLVQGHNRLYYHTVTCQPNRPQDIDEDSEDESTPSWLYKKTVMMIDEFTDVNEGEKELMKMWNLHIMKHNYMADCQIVSACTTFVEEHGNEILEKNLSRNFLIHLVNLFDFSLIRPEVVQRSYAMLENLRESMGLA
ncbi:polycomb protein suz12-B-like isoform X1 [Pomacea canaliculata]|uniref:polycomb protein suz12-B-like isoform X1 n=1 Tax=Pomacea canaliculata TaxID=400727 RepID=UPI000D73F2BC|nr:polycomb protein suz12-B-like isoform X1 [Pomacea canaliculata]